jgi:hypothetical protein
MIAFVDFEMTGNEAAVTYFKILSQHSLGRTEENKNLPGYRMFLMGLEPSTLKVMGVGIS